jgi:type I restriction enzyme S subunit
MGNIWLEYAIGDLGRVVTGKTPPTADPENYGGILPFITPSDMKGQKYIDRTERTISSKGVKHVKNLLLPPRTVFVSCIGSDMGKVGMTKVESVTNQQINSIIVKEDIDSEYVYYDLCFRKDELQRLATSGSAQPILNKGHFSQLKINVPPLPEQKAIASILGALDDKIELNRKMNETLEAMARANFKSWFIDFDPIPGLGPHKEWQDSSLGKIPKGWSVKSLAEIADYLNGLALQKFPPENDHEFLPIIKIAQLKKDSNEGSDKASANIDPAYVISDGNILFSWSGSLEVVIWCGGRGALNQHLFKVTSNLYPKWFYYFWTKHHLSDFQAIAATKATTMGHIQRHHLTEAKVLVPLPDQLDIMNTIINPLIEKRITNAIQSRSLATIRDALLPKLLSGEIRIKDVGKFMKEELYDRK